MKILSYLNLFLSIGAIVACSELDVKPSSHSYAEKAGNIEKQADSTELEEGEGAKSEDQTLEDLQEMPGTNAAPASLTCTPSEKESAQFFPRRMRRLSTIQIGNILKDALGNDFPMPALSGDSEPDFAIKSSASRIVEANFLTLFADLATIVSTYVLENKDTKLKALFNCGDVAKLGDLACQENFVKNFGRILFRKHLSKAETDKYLDFFKSLAEAKNTEKFKLMVEYMVHSSDFLYASELGNTEDVSKLTSVTPVELASMLALALTDRGPSDALLAKAAAGDLSDPDKLKATIESLLEEPISGNSSKLIKTDFFQKFTLDWLNLEDLHIAENDQYKALNLKNTTPKKLSEDMLHEITLVAKDIIESDAPTFENLLSYKNTKVNKSLAIVYGLDESRYTLDEFTDAELNSEERSGILTSAAFLTKHAEGITHIGRGNALNLDILCIEVPAFPDLDKAADIENAPTPGNNPNKTFRENFQVHSKNPCAACHEIIDPPGWAMGKFNDMGKFSPFDAINNKEIDASDKLILASGDEMKFEDGLEFVKKTSETSDAHYCYTKKMYHHFTGSPVFKSNMCQVKTYAKSFMDGSRSIKELMINIMTSDLYIKRQ